MASLKENMKSECGISAFSLALSIVTSNPELASKVCDLAEQAAEAGLRSDALKEGALQGIEGDVKSLSHDYTLKEQSADMKFKAVVFGGLFDKTAQGDEALRIIGDEILNTGGTVSEGIELFNLIDNMDVSSIVEVAKIMTNGDLEAANELIGDIHSKLSYYIGTDYSVVTTGNPVKLAGVIKQYEKKIKEAQKKIDDALKKTGGKQLRHIDGDLEKVNNLKGTTIEGKQALAKIGKEYGVEDGKRLKERLTKKLTDLKKAKDTLEEARKEKKSLKAAKEYKEALAGDMKIIEDGGNPFHLIEGDDQWKFIKGFNAEPTKRAQQYGQYVLARALLTGGKDLPQEVIDIIKSGINGGVVNYLDEHLTEDWILDEDRTLDELLARAYTNTADLANNGQLRNIYRQRLMSLASAGEISLKDVDYIESLINTLSFAGAGSGFSDVLKYEYLTRAARDLGIDVPSSRGKDFRDSIINLFKKDQKDFQRAIAGDFVKLGNGIELTNRQLLELVADMLSNTNINKLIASDTLTDREILDIAGKYLIGDAVSGGNRLKELFDAAKNAPATNDTRGVILKTITGQDVTKGAKVGFFDFRRGLKADPSVDMRAKFYERLSNANTLELPSNSIEDITDNLERKISEFKGGYILVNDSQYKMSKRFTDALDKVNQGATKPEERVTVIYPSGGLMGTITSDGGKLIYRTSYTSKFNQLVRNISIRTLGQSDVDTRFSKELQDKLLGGDVDALAEYNKLLEEDAQRYFGEMLGIGEEAYKEKLQPMLEQATGISFKNYDAIVDKTEFWKKVDENFILATKVNGNMEQEFITIGDVVKEVDSLTPAEMSSRLSDMFGFEITAKHISDGKKINQEIRDAFLAYRLSETPIELLERKGKLLALINGGTADNITVNQFKAILQSGDFTPYKDLFFHNLELSDEELAKHAKSINDMIFNSLCADAAMNLVKMGYSLPMVNIRDLVYDFLMDRLNVNGNFARAFLFKNGLPDTLETLRGIVNEIMPKDLRFGYDDGFKLDTGNYYNSIGVRKEGGWDPRYKSYIDVLTDGTLFRDGYRRRGNTANWINLVDSSIAVNAPSAVNGMSVKQLADMYGVPLFVAADSWLDNLGAFGVLGRTNLVNAKMSGHSFVQSMINLRKTIPEGTASHELFHAIFLTLAPDDTRYFIDEAKRLYNYDERVANEMLADLFSEYFRTGSFSLPRQKAAFRNTAEEQRFISWIKQFFGKMAAWLGLVDTYEKQVGKLFDDIIDGKIKTTKSALTSDQIKIWNAQFANSWRNSYLPNNSRINNGEAQAKMIMLVDSRISQLIDGKVTFSEYKKALGKEFPGLKSYFDSVKKSELDLKSKTIGGLDYGDWRRAYFNEEGYAKHDGKVTPDDIIKGFIDATSGEFADTRYRYLINTLLDVDENILLSQDVPYTTTRKHGKYLLNDLYDMANLEREYYLAKIDNGEVVYGGSTSYPSRAVVALDNFIKRLERDIKKRPKVRESAELSSLYTRIKGLEGQDFNEVLNKITGGGYGIPVEIGIFVDENGKIVSIGRGGAKSISPSSEVPSAGAETFYHSHPEVGRFSGHNGPHLNEGGDLVTFARMPYKNVGLINPGGVVLTFENTDKFRMIADSAINPLLQAITGGTPYYSNRWGTIQAGLITSLMTGEFDKQNWGVFDSVVKRNANKVKFIVDKYNVADFDGILKLGNQISDADKRALEMLGKIIKDEVRAYSLYYITHGPYVDAPVLRKGIGDMFNYSNTEDTMGRYLTKGQEKFGFATVKDVKEILPSGTKLNFVGSNDDDIVRAYFSVSDASDAGLGYDVYFMPTRMGADGLPKVPSNQIKNLPTSANACYIRISSPDKIVQSTDKLFSIMSRDDMLYRIYGDVSYRQLYKAISNAPEGITIKEFLELIEEALPATFIGDGIRQVFFDVIDGYYDKSKEALHLFYYDDVKDANNLNPKNVPNVYFDSGYSRPVGRYTDPATGIKYELGPRDFRNLFDRGEEVVTEFVPIEELDKLKEYDRRLDPKWSKADSDETIDWLKEDFQSKGVLKPLKIDYSVTDGKAYLAEGNHRLAAAKELGMKYLPAQVYVLKTTDVGKGIKAPRKLEQAAINYYPESAAPSEIGIKGTINSFDDRGYDEIGYGSPTYSNSAFDSDGRMITDQQDNFFEESQFRDEDGDILTLYRGATDGWEETDLGRNLRYRGDGHLKIFLTPSKDIVKHFGGVTKKRGTKLKNIDELQELLDGAKHRYERNVKLIAKDLGNGQYEVIKQHDYLLGYGAPEGYFGKVRENGNDIIRTKIGERKEGRRRLPEVREEETLLKGTLRDIDKKLDRVLYPSDPVLAPYNPHYYEVYGLSKNPLIIDAKGVEWNEVAFNGEKMTTDDIADWAYDNGYDGVIFKNVKEQFYRDGKPLPGDFITDDYVVFSQGQLKSVDNTVPTEGEHWRDNTGYGRQPLVPDYKPRLVETKNQFTQDTYSSLIAMAAVKNGERIPSLGNEERQLERILDDYYNAVAKATENGKTLSFAEAQKLKVKAGYALDMFEQDYVLPRYKNFLTPQERSELMGLKYGLAVGTNSDSLKTIKDYNESVLNRYKTATQHIISQSDLFISGLGDIDVTKEIEKRQEQLMTQGATLKEVDGQVIVVDVRDELFKELQSIPNNILGLENLKALGRNGLAQLSNEQAYFLLNVVQLSKNMENKTNLIIQTIYKVSPQLARIDFFNTYRLEGGLPRILNNNTLSKSEFISKFNNTTDFDRKMKETILSMVKEKFARNGKLEYDELKKIINDALTVNKKLLGNTIKGFDWIKFKKDASLLYTSAFQPYTYLKDVPKEVKVSIGNILSEQQKGIRQALNAMGDNDKLAEVMDNIFIYAGDGTVKSFRNALDGEPADINKILFNSDNEIIRGADELAATPTDTKMSRYKRRKIEKENENVIKGMVSNYEEGLRSYMNGSEMVSQAERDLLNTTLTAARQIAKKYTSTNTIAETDNALASINEEIIRRFKADILGLTGKFSKGGQRWDIGTRIQGGIMDKWGRVQDRYAQYYSMSDKQLLQIKASGPIDTMALNMAKYFKEIERRLGSIDGLTGVTTDPRINRAFGHIGQVVMNVKTINGLYSLMSGIEGNQILKFFRFSNPKQLSYVKEFVIGGEGKETLGGYRTYVDGMDEGLNRDWFNKTFATNFSQTEYRKIVQALTGFTIINKKWKRVESALNFANSSNYLFRALMSYPGQLITIANQSIAYFLRQKGREDSLGIEDLGAIDEVRKGTGILNGTYNEINWFNGYSPDDLDPSSFYNRYGIPDVDNVYKSKKFYSTDDIETIYAKIDEYSSSDNFRDKLHDKWAMILRNTDAYKDNANNIIDGIFARNFKNIAFVRALQSNSVMRFGTAEQFVRFMASDAPESMKKRLMTALASDSGKHFRNMLGLGFSGLDRAVSGGNKILPAWASNILVGLTQLFNFRGAWGQNIARQTNNVFLTAIKMGKAGFSKEGRDAIALFLARQPEFVNFTAQLFNDLKNSRRLVRFQDNGRLPDEDDEYNWMDFIEYAADNMQFASQRWQGIQSYGTTRIGTERLESVLKSHEQPDIYKDTYGVGAFFNALQKNFGRNWKVPAFAVKAIAQGVTNGTDAFWAYLGNEWWKLSFGTLRYLMNEDFTSYGYSTEMPRRRVGIPYVLTGEPDEGDKAFSYDLSNTETWENISNWYNASVSGDLEAASTYAMNLWDTAFNSSQLLGTVKGVGQILNGTPIVPSTIKGLMDDMHFYKIVNPFDLAEAGDIVGETEAGADIMKYGYYIPKNADDVKTFIDTIIGQSKFRPGNESFNKSFFNFDSSGHMQNFDESNEKDAPMEMLLNNMKYLRDENRAFVLDEKGNKIVTNYWEKHMDEIERKINDEDFLTQSNFNFIYNWVEANNTDPNYMLYKKLIGEGIAGNYIAQKANEYVSDFNGINGYKKTEKMTLDDLKDSKYYDWFITALTSSKLNHKGETIPFLEALATLDENALMEADIKIVEKQLSKSGNQEAIKKFFSIDKKGNVNLTTKYKSYLMEQGRLSNYLREGDLDSFLAETASVTKVFKKDDPYGLMTTTLLGSRVNMINSSDYLSAEQKAKAINVLFKDNSDFIQTHIPEMISELGDKAEAYITQMNDSLYGSSIISDKLITDNEMNNSKSGRSAAKSASDTIKVIMADLAKAAGDSEIVGTKKYNYNFTPAKLNGSKLLDFVGGKGYTPTTPTAAIQQYTPHSKFTLKKDVNRLVNGPKTQAVSKKKLLSKLESDTLKAFEAES